MIDELFARAYAHRGLWSPHGPPENSLAAFEAAAAAEYGVELDARLSKEGEAVVFHDTDLARMTGASGEVRERSVDELAGLRLQGTGEPILTLEQALGRIAGQAPVLIELKTRSQEVGPLERRVAQVLAGYRGAAAAVSFNWRALALLAREAPSLARGLNSSDHVDENAEVVARDPALVLQGFDAACPHFLSLGKELCGGERLRPLPTLAWTIRSPTEAERVSGASDTIIFEGFRP